MSNKPQSGDNIKELALNVLCFMYGSTRKELDALLKEEYAREQEELTLKIGGTGVETRPKVVSGRKKE